MKTFSIITLGCKVNQYESQQIRQLLESCGLCPAATSTGADLVVANTCCVTSIASSKSRQAIRKALRENRHATLLVAGCLPASQTDELGDLTGDIHFVGQKSDLGQKLRGLIDRNSPKVPRGTIKPSSQAKIKHKTHPPASNYHDKLGLLRSYAGQSRAFVKIQDGCDGFCTYCIVPTIRTELSSKPPDAVLKEVSDLVYAGHKEIVLTGIFLGAYGQDTVRRWKWDAGKSSFAGLLGDVASVDGLERVRLSSLEPADMTDELVDVFCKYPNIMPHLHLPLQSGSERILKKMGRQYDREAFLKTVASLKEKLDRPAITTDIIVGFPGETEKDFEETMAVAQDVGFSKIHVFSFSPRKNTPAHTMDNKIAPEVIKERSKILHELDEQLQKKFREKFAGEKVGVIIEDAAERKGRCERYFMVHFDGDETLSKGELVYGTLNEDGKTAQPCAIER